MTKKQKIEAQKIVARRNLFGYEVRVVTGCLHNISDSGKIRDTVGLRGKYGVDVYDEDGEQMWFSGSDSPTDNRTFNNIEKAFLDASKSIQRLRVKLGQASDYGIPTDNPEDRKFYRTHSGWGEPDDWGSEGPSKKQCHNFADNCWTSWKYGIGGYDLDKKPFRDWDKS